MSQSSGAKWQVYKFLSAHFRHRGSLHRLPQLSGTRGPHHIPGVIGLQCVDYSDRPVGYCIITFDHLFPVFRVLLLREGGGELECARKCVGYNQYHRTNRRELLNLFSSIRA